MVYKILLKLRYLVKHAAFKEEQECRIIQIAEFENEKRVKADDNRFYIEYLELNKENVKNICFGPKAEGIGKFKQQLARNKENNFKGIECSQSTAPLA